MHYKAFIPLLFLFSCTAIIKKATKINRKFSFTSQSEYYHYLVNKKKFHSDQILFPDSVSYVKFGQMVLMDESPVIYFGSFLNDSVSIKKSNILKNNQGCSGRMNGEIEKNLRIADYSDSIIETKVNLKRFNFYYLGDKRKFNLSDSKKQLKIFLLYYYPFGTTYDKLYKEIIDACLRNVEKTELYFVCVDPVYTLKN